MPHAPARLPALTAIALLGLAAATAVADETPSFRRDVMAVLSKAGCNQGTCHGNANGKGGFKLSLRGEDPAWDYRALTRDVTSRRINPIDPARSLLVEKPLLQVPHDGGGRFRSGSPEFEILTRWIAAGAHDDGDAVVTSMHIEPREAVVGRPDQEVPLRVTATFAGGETRDVTRWAVYEPSQPIVEISPEGVVRGTVPGEVTIAVRYLNQQAPVRLAFLAPREVAWSAPERRNPIDDFVFAKLEALRIPPSAVCDDVTFLRRAFLDLVGLLPTAEDAREFVASTSPDKRAHLVDELLDRPEFAETWAMKWSDLLRSEEKTLDRKGVENLHAWLCVQLANDARWNDLARDLLSARGSTYVNPAANYYRALRDPFVRAETTAQVFLGVRLQCAKCHSHPFDRWTQNDYYAWTNAFARVDYKIRENNRRDSNDSHEFDGEQIVYMKPAGDVKDPRTGQPRSPRMLDPAEAPLAEDTDRLEELAEWVVSPTNPYFAKAQANRVWFHLMGRGLVDPIDDFRITNPASHPELLDWLAAEFAAREYRLKPLIRLIMNSTTYQLDSATREENADDELNYSHAVPRRLTAESLSDALAQVLDVRVGFKGYPNDVRAGQLPGVGPMRSRDGGLSQADRFLRTFGKPPRLQSCECERVASPTLAQTFQLVSGPLMDDLLTQRDNRIGIGLREGRSDSDLVRELYWAILSREPTPAEFEAASARISQTDGERARRDRFEDLAWALVNSNEFLFRR